jgi:hypothetical protein
LDPEPDPDPLARGTDPYPHQNVTDPQHWKQQSQESGVRTVPLTRTCACAGRGTGDDSQGGSPLTQDPAPG